MAHVLIDDRALEALVDLIGIRYRLSAALVADPHRLADCMDSARQAYAMKIEPQLAPYRGIAVVERMVREFEGLASIPRIAPNELE